MTLQGENVYHKVCYDLDDAALLQKEKLMFENQKFTFEKEREIFTNAAINLTKEVSKINHFWQVKLHGSGCFMVISLALRIDKTSRHITTFRPQISMFCGYVHFGPWTATWFQGHALMPKSCHPL